MKFSKDRISAVMLRASIILAMIFPLAAFSHDAPKVQEVSFGAIGKPKNVMRAKLARRLKVEVGASAIYLPTGVPCNVCDIKEGYTQIVKMSLDTTGMDLVAMEGLNIVGFDFHPKISELWYPNSGRDWLSEDLPNEYTQPALLFGAHTVALGTRFYAGKQFQKKYKNAMISSRQGPWNRTKKYVANIAVSDKTT
jgi:glucose/arabinose dehydrogenase